MTFGSMGLGLGLATRGGGSGGGGFSWSDYSPFRVHDAALAASIGSAVDAQVTSWADAENGLAAYTTRTSTGVYLREHASGVRYVESDGASSLSAASNTSLRGTRAFVLARTPASTIRPLISSASDSASFIDIPFNSKLRVRGKSGQAPYSVTEFLISGALATSTWYVFDIEMTESNGAALIIDGVTVSTASGSFTSQGATDFNADILFGNFAATVQAAMAVQSFVVVPAETLSAGQVAEIMAELVARRVALAGA